MFHKSLDNLYTLMYNISRDGEENKYLSKKGKGEKKKMTTYNVYAYGQITKYEAGVFYRNWKSGNIKALPEMAKDLYGQTNDYIRFSKERYNQNSRSYDVIYDLTRALLINDYVKAQELVDEYQIDKIERAGKKSIWYGKKINY